MKRILLYIVILLGLTALPVHYQDVADLEPIRAVWVSAEETAILLQADTGDQGRPVKTERAAICMVKKAIR